MALIPLDQLTGSDVWKTLSGAQKLKAWQAWESRAIEEAKSRGIEGRDLRRVKAAIGKKKEELDIEGSVITSLRRAAANTRSNISTLRAGDAALRNRENEKILRIAESEIKPGEAILSGNDVMFVPRNARLITVGSGEQGHIYAVPEGTKKSKTIDEFRRGVASRKEELVEFSGDRLEAADEQSQAASKLPVNPKLQQFVEEMESGEFGEAAKTLFNPLNFPRIAANVMAESAVSLAGGVAGGIAGGAPGAAIGGVGPEFGASYREALQVIGAEAGIDTSTPEGMAEAMMNDEVNDQSLKRAAIRAGVIGAFNAISQGIAGKIVNRLKDSVGKKVVASAVAGSSTEMAGEGAAQKASGQELSPTDIVLEGLGGPAETLGQVAGEIAKRKVKYKSPDAKKGQIYDDPETGESMRVTDVQETQNPKTGKLEREVTAESYIEDYSEEDMEQIARDYEAEVLDSLQSDSITLDEAIQDIGGLVSPSKAAQYGEEFRQVFNESGRKVGNQKIGRFRDDGKQYDIAIGLLRQYGFQFENPSELADAIYRNDSGDIQTAIPLSAYKTPDEPFSREMASRKEGESAPVDPANPEPVNLKDPESIRAAAERTTETQEEADLLGTAMAGFEAEGNQEIDSLRIEKVDEVPGGDQVIPEEGQGDVRPLPNTVASGGLARTKMGGTLTGRQGFGDTVESALTAIRDSDADKSYRNLASKILEKNYRGGNRVRIEYREAEPGDKAYRANFDHSSNTINVDKETGAYPILHEAIHAYSTSVLTSEFESAYRDIDTIPEFLSVKKNTSKAVEEFVEVFAAARLAVPDLSGFSVANPDKVQAEAREKGIDPVVGYALANPSEFLSIAMTDHTFQAWLKSQPSSRNESLWDRLVAAVRNILGLSKEETSLLDDVLESGFRVMGQQEIAGIRQADGVRRAPGSGTFSGFRDKKDQGYLKTRVTRFLDSAKGKTLHDGSREGKDRLRPALWEAAEKAALEFIGNNPQRTGKPLSELPGLNAILREKLERFVDENPNLGDNTENEGQQEQQDSSSPGGTVDNGGVDPEKGEDAVPPFIRPIGSGGPIEGALGTVDGDGSLNPTTGFLARKSQIGQWITGEQVGDNDDARIEGRHSYRDLFFWLEENPLWVLDEIEIEYYKDLFGQDDLPEAGRVVQRAIAEDMGRSGDRSVFVSDNARISAGQDIDVTQSLELQEALAQARLDLLDWLNERTPRMPEGGLRPPSKPENETPGPRLEPGPEEAVNVDIRGDGPPVTVNLPQPGGEEIDADTQVIITNTDNLTNDELEILGLPPREEPLPQPGGEEIDADTQVIITNTDNLTNDELEILGLPPREEPLNLEGVTLRELDSYYAEQGAKAHMGFRSALGDTLNAGGKDVIREVRALRPLRGLFGETAGYRDLNSPLRPTLKVKSLNSIIRSAKRAGKTKAQISETVSFLASAAGEDFANWRGSRTPKSRLRQLFNRLNDSPQFSNEQKKPNILGQEAQPSRDAEYLEAVRAGDMDKAQAMVDEAARVAGVSTIKERNGRLMFDGQDVGVLEISPNEKGVVEIERLYIDAEHRRQGIGSAVIPYLFQKGFREVRAYPLTDSWWLKQEPENLESDGTFVYSRANPSQIKSADPVTYDSSGNVIPLSQRFDSGSDSILYQDTSKWQGFYDRSQKLIGLLPAADASTVFHEVAHAGRQMLAGTELGDTLNKAYNTDGDNWTRGQEEQFARDFERYLRDGRPPKNASAKLRKAFSAVAEMMRKIYAELTGSPLANDIKPEVREVLDRVMLSGDAIMNQGQTLNKQVSASAINEKNPNRIPIKPEEGEVQRNSKVMFNAGRQLGASLSYKTGPRGTYGSYFTGNSRVSIEYEGDLDTTAHELGHAIDDRMGLGKAIKDRGLQSAIDSEILRPEFQATTRKKDSIAVKRTEGLAEFVRGMMVNPELTRQKAPTLAKLFDSLIQPPALRALNNFGKAIRAWEAAPASVKLEANVQMKPDHPFRRAVDLFRGAGKANQSGFVVNAWDRLAALMLDDKHPFLKAVNMVEKLAGQKPLPKDDPRILARLLQGVGSKELEVLERGMINAKQERVLPGGVSWLFEPFGKGTAKELDRMYKDSVMLMVAERTVELSDRLGREDAITGSGAGIASDLEVAQDVIAEMQQDPDRYQRLKEAGDRYRQWADANLEYLVEKGRMTKKAYKEIKDANQYYVAFNRIMEAAPGEEMQALTFGAGKNLGSVSETVNRLKGSSKTIQNPYISLLESSSKIISEADRNEVLASFVDLLDSATDRGMYEGETNQMASIAVKLDARKKLPPQTQVIYRKGKREAWQITDPDVYAALKGLGNMASMPGWLRLGTIPAKVLRAGVTMMPDFAIRNLMRDTQQRFLVSRSELSKSLKGTLPAKDRADILEALKLGGGDQAGFYTRDQSAYLQSLDMALRDLATDKNSIVMSGKRFADFFGQNGPYRRLLERSEQANRLAEYRASFAEGKRRGYDDFNAHLFASSQARDLMDFAVGGEMAKAINQFVPFFNAAIQGTRRTVRAARENPQRFAARFTLFAIIPTVMHRALIASMGEEVEDEYEEMPDYLRDLFWNFKVADNKWLRIPKSFESGVLASLSDRLIGLSRGYDNALDGFGGSLARAFIPVDGQTVFGPFRPWFEAVTNYDTFRGKTIISPYQTGVALDAKNKKGERIRKMEQASRMGQAFQLVAEGVGLSNTDTGKKLLDARKVDHLIKGTFGGMGDAALRVSNLGREDTSRIPGWRNTGLIVNAPGYSAKSVQEVYKMARDYGLRQNKILNDLDDLINKSFEVKTEKERDEIAREIRAEARRVKPILEAEIKALNG